MLDKSIATILVGIAAVMTSFPLDGLGRGLGQGAGVALILIGVATLSARLRKRGDRGLWLPSRDDR
ncbi:hypothetical protein FHP29_15985 [Nocardioides albidus]|uniref:Uncharacterized protein n=1 Tax=Nocardioides albidus TaxID=1517589 RepID=A0A5C4VNF3_9ACTN|nr:hypothetical protein [Nocardioides albidus]TNM37341.1 hypothetical protein FHP29_15985 [Nocardioides albidus]